MDNVAQRNEKWWKIHGLHDTAGAESLKFTNLVFKFDFEYSAPFFPPVSNNFPVLFIIMFTMFT